MRFGFFARLFNHFHFVQFFLAAFCHVGCGYARLVAGNKVFQLGNFLLLAFISRFFLRLVNGVHFLEFVVVAGVTGKLAVFQVVNNINHFI